MSSGASLQVGVAGIGLLGPGFNDWASGQSLLVDPAHWANVPTVLPAPLRLPPAERRRAGAVVKLSMAAADQACAQAGLDIGTLATVFSASGGDGANCHALCEVLATPERLVSPTRFTNSVHNAPAGYWHIAAASRAPSTSLSAHDGSFGAGLLEAASQCVSWQRPVLFVASDTQYPEPLRSARPIPDAFAIALLLVPTGSAVGPAALDISPGEGAPTRLPHESQEALRMTVPAARGLPLLRQIALGRPGRCSVEYLDGLALQIDVRPGVPA